VYVNVNVDRFAVNVYSVKPKMPVFSGHDYRITMIGIKQLHHENPAILAE